MFKMENAAVPDGRCRQTLPRQLGVSDEPRQLPGQVHIHVVLYVISIKVAIHAVI